MDDNRTARRGFAGRALLLVLRGILVGFGAVLPAISGGTLCAAFGMYRPLIEVLSSPGKGLRRHWKRLLPFLIGVAAGFVGLSGLAGWLMGKDSAAVTCVFLGFILGTFPELWRDAGTKGRTPRSYAAVAAGFAGMLALLLILRGQNAMSLTPGLWSYLLCGVLWGLGFVVPGLSSSTLLLFFGLYRPMLDGIARLSMPVLLPLAAGVALCLVTLPRAVGAAYRRFDSVLSHAMIGVVAATAVMIVPRFSADAGETALCLFCIVGGAAASLAIGRVCARLA